MVVGMMRSKGVNRLVILLAILYVSLQGAQKKIVICYASGIGQGHHSAAYAIAAQFAQLGIEQQVVLKDFCAAKPLLNAVLQEHLYMYLPKEHPDLYYLTYLLTDTTVYPLVQMALMNVFHADFIESVVKEDPAIIVATQAFAAGSIARAKLEGKLKAQLITVITDIYPHYSWIFPATDYYWVMDKESKKYLERKGVAHKKIIVGGIPVSPTFVPQNNGPELRFQLGLPPDRLTLLLVNGGWGIGTFKEILKHLEPLAERISCCVVCGHNADAKQELERGNYKFPLRIFGFTNQMPALMAACDILIGKPGGVTMSIGFKLAVA